MKKLEKIKILACFCLVPFAHSVNAAPIYSSSVAFFECESSFCEINNEDFQNVAGSTSSASLSNEVFVDKRLAGLENTDPVKATITYNGEAETSASGLRAKVSGTQFNESFEPEISDTLKTGSEQHFVQAESRLRDTISVTGASGLSSIEFDIDIDGTRANAFFGSFIQVRGPGVIFGSNSSEWDGIDDFDLTIQSSKISVTGGSVDIELSLLTGLDFFVGGEGFLEEENNLFREVDFYNTVTLGQFRGFDAFGELIDLSSATGSGGQSFDVLRVAPTPVSEPSTLALAMIGIGGIIIRRKKKM